MKIEHVFEKCRTQIKIYEENYKTLIDCDLDLPTRALVFNAYSRSEFAREILNELASETEHKIAC